MITIDQLRISGIRRVGDARLQLGPLTVMIGANGVGKSSVLDALSLLDAAARGRLAERVGELGGFNSFATRRMPLRVEFELSFQGPEQTGGDYNLVLDAAGTGYTVSSEILTRRGDASKKPLDLLHYSQGTIHYSGEAPRTYDAMAAAQVVEAFLSGRPSLAPWQDRLGSVLYHRTPNVGRPRPQPPPRPRPRAD